ncbi:MAG: FecR domain-containing protein [Candidatus Marinimicrobia bacterium]|nr:FecR domain-containing protein [Candidatus Neomarinimicrobiota bacterium]
MYTKIDALRAVSAKLLIALFLTAAALPLAAQTDALARVLKSTGTVTLKRRTEATFGTALLAAMQLFNGDAISSGDDGFVSLVFLDDRTLLKIKANSQLEIIESANTRNIQMQFGTMRSKLDQPLKDFSVATPNSVASVKGTDFWTVSDATAGVDQFYGIEGFVEVLNTISGLTQSLTAGTLIQSFANGQITPPVPVTPAQMPVDPDDAPEPQPEPEGEGEATPDETPAETPTEPAPDPGAGEPAQQTVFEGLTQDIATVAAAADTVQEDMEEPAEEPEAETPSGPGLGLGLGSVTLDGVTYTSIALRPEFSVGKLGVGLDIVAYMDAEGNFRDDEWDEPSDIMDKIMYLRWGTAKDPFFFQIGALPNVQYGFGAIMSSYTNMAQFPEVRKVGFEIGGNVSDRARLRVFAADLKEFASDGGLVGLRGSYKLSRNFPLTLGLNLVTDLNQYNGLTDKDGDGYPDFVDDFPDDKRLRLDSDGDGIADKFDSDVDGDDLLDFGTDNDGDGIIDGTELLDTNGDGLPGPGLPYDSFVDRKSVPFNKKDNEKSILGVSLDLSYPIISNKLLTLTAYSEYGMLHYGEDELLGLVVQNGIIDTVAKANSGWGLVGPGVRGRLFGFIDASLEYRRTSSLFLPGFFNSTYDFERAQAASGTDSLGSAIETVKTKDQVLINNPYALSGFYGSASANLFNLVTLGAAYQNLIPADTSAEESNSFIASLSINTDPIPKISEAMAYYIRNNDPDVFAFNKPSPNTTWGFRVAYALAPNVEMVYNQQVSYRWTTGGEIEEVRLLTIETAFRF